MDFWQIIEGRHSVREFDSNREVSDEEIKKVIEAAKRAPSAGDLRDWRFFIIRDPSQKDKLSRAALDQEFIAEAPVVIVVGSDLEVIGGKYGKRGEELYSALDVGLAAENLLLAATALGLGAVPVGAFNENEVKKILGIKGKIRPMLIIPIGHSKVEG